MAELEILHSELEKATLRISEVEARNEQLRMDLVQSTSKAGSAQKVSVEDDPAFLRLRSENSSLLRKLESARYEKGSEHGRLEGRIKQLEREMAASNEDRGMLRTKLEKCSDYDEIKQELEMIRVCILEARLNRQPLTLHRLSSLPPETMRSLGTSRATKQRRMDTQNPPKGNHWSSCYLGATRSCQTN